MKHPQALYECLFIGTDLANLALQRVGNLHAALQQLDCLHTGRDKPTAENNLTFLSVTHK